METDRGYHVHLNVILTHSDPTSFFICESVFHLPSKWCGRIVTNIELSQVWNFPATLLQRFEPYNIEDLLFMISAPVKTLLFYGFYFGGMGGGENIRRDCYIQLDKF